jgi:fructose-1,6-bisphosphatase
MKESGQSSQLHSATCKEINNLALVIFLKEKIRLWKEDKNITNTKLLMNNLRDLLEITYPQDDKYTDSFLIKYVGKDYNNPKRRFRGKFNKKN